jgi:hypothetical protein
MPFTNDKQTLLLAALTRAYQRVNAPLVCLNVTASRPASSSSGRRYAANLRQALLLLLHPNSQGSVIALHPSLHTR